MSRVTLRRIPAIDDLTLRELAARIRPARRDERGTWRAVDIEEKDLRGVGFTWRPASDVIPGGVGRHVAALVTFHTYGAPALFKPSVAEVLAQAPREVREAARWFALWEEPMTVEHTLADGYHFARVDFYGGAS